MRIHVIYGGQFGSESKRLFTEYYANKWKPEAIITNALPNSGGFDSANKKWSALPIGYPAKLMISPGSAIDPENLKKEIAQLPEGSKIIIHKHAVMVNPRNRNNELELIKIGSTMTGGAEAVIAKMRRNPSDKILAQDFFMDTVDNAQWLKELWSCNRVLAICAQGHSLSLNFGFYPFCTSRNTSPAQVIADAGLPMQLVERVIGCFRTFPIRVSNRYDEQGRMIGFSGPCYDDQKELSWNDVGVPEEMTSVSKKVRRVFTFSVKQMMESIYMNGTTDIFLGFLNYIKAGQQGAFIKFLEHSMKEVPCEISWVGVDKTIADIYETGEYSFNRSWV